MKKYINKKGFTLLELILTIVIMSIGGVFLSSFAVPMISLYGESSKEMEARSMADTIFNKLLNELEFAKEFVINDGTESNTQLSYKNPDDSINGETFGEQIFPETKFDITISFSFNNINRILTIKIKIDDERGREITVKEITLLSPNALDD
ncbi:MAG: type II secretion system protein [Tissierellia bacterium]|nr:type II secretion system protein [Tissierellia bacterium]